MKQISSIFLIIVLLASFFGVWQTAQASPLSADTSKTALARVDPAVQSALNSALPNDTLTVIVTLKDQANLTTLLLPNRSARQRAVIDALQTHAQASQRAINALLEAGKGQGRVSKVVPFWIFNGLSVTGSAAVIQELSKRLDVDSITPDSIDIVPVGSPDLASQNLASPAANLSAINAPAMWSLGYYGQGVVVANLDSGVDINHPDLAARWRGGSNSWYDPYNQHPTTPTDLSGHGTWTMGAMVAGDASGVTLGIAPQAQWIAARIFSDKGVATATAIHLAFQWVLNPDGNPATADAPQVVNNSWSYGNPGCNLAFQNDVRALRSAGILPVFAAGNYGPTASTSVSPANYPEAFAVGAVDNNGSLYTSGSHGPSACGETISIYPELVTPGVSITTPDLFGLYATNSGTSLSSPHVAGALALLLSAFPGLSVDSQSAALLNTAVDRGSLGADNSFGYGELDVLAAYNWLAGISPATTTPSPTPTATFTTSPSPTPAPTLTATFTPMVTDTATATATSTATASTVATATASATATATASATASATATVTPSPTNALILFADGFESGSFSAWSDSATNSGLLSIASQAAMVGANGMQGTINNTTAMYVQDNSPTAEKVYHARFYFSPNTASLSVGKTHDLLIGRNNGAITIFHVQFGRTSTGLAVRLLARTTSSDVSTAAISLNPGSNAIEITWKAATTSTGANGSAELYVNGSLAATLPGLANGKYTLEDVRLGPQTLTSGISGVEYFDAFASSRGSYIGP